MRNYFRYKNSIFSIGLLLLLALAGILLSLKVGAVNISWREILSNKNKEIVDIIYTIRLPRIVMALLVGGGLSLSGAGLQVLLRNPLAEPYIVGVSSGASLGMIIFLGLRKAIGFSFSFMPVAAFVGGLLSVIIVYRISLVAGQLSTNSFLLVGIMIGTFLWSWSALMMLLSKENIYTVMLWLMGSFSGSSWQKVLAVLPYWLVGFILLVFRSRELNLLTLGEEQAFYLGVNVEKLKRELIFSTTVLTSACVAVSGIIGFIGLLVPHISRFIWGADHRILLFTATLLGGTFLLFSDTLARTLVTPAEIPVGIITALIGAPLFCWLLKKNE